MSCKFQDRCLFYLKNGYKGQECQLHFLYEDEEDFCPASKSFDEAIDSIVMGAEETRQSLKLAKNLLIDEDKPKQARFLTTLDEVKEYMQNGNPCVVTKEQYKELEKEKESLQSELNKLKRIGNQNTTNETFQNKILENKLDDCKQFLQYVVDCWELETKKIQDKAIELLRRLS